MAVNAETRAKETTGRLETAGVQEIAANQRLENEPDHELCAKEVVVDHVMVDPARRNTTTTLRSRVTNTQIAREGGEGKTMQRWYRV